MDIVDTFNHLIPTEHLDDALFLGTNLESEGCDEFATSHHVIEDSLKNMLSDKDPMLGSASTQFCLPVLDNTEPNFQIPPSTGVGLDDIMDVGVDKVTGVDVNDEVGLILPNKNVTKLDEQSIKSVRKSPRLKVHEPSKTMRQSTNEKSLNSVNVLSPIKATSSRQDKAAEQVKDEEHILHVEANDKSIGMIELEQISISPVNSRRSTRIANKEFKDKIITDENISIIIKECSSTVNDILSNTDSILKKTEEQSEILHEGALILLSENTNKAVEEITNHELNNSQGDQTADQVLETPVEEKIFNNEMFQPADSKTDVIYDKVHQELALLSGVVDCNLGVKSLVHLEMNDECVLQNAAASSIQENIDTETHLIASEVLSPNNKYTSDPEVSILESSIQNNTEGFEADEEVQTEEKAMSVLNDGCRKLSRKRKGAKKLKSNSAKLVISAKNTPKNIVVSKESSLNSKTQKGRIKTNTLPNPKSESQSDTLKIVKVKKKRPESTNVDKIPLKTKLRKKQFSVGKKGNSSALLKQLDDALRDNQRNLKETLQVASHVHSKNLSHSCDKSVTKHALSKASNQAKDGGEHKEVTEHSEEKTKLKKSLPPRQRRSSKSLSVDEPPLFIPDNIPTVKKEGAEVASPSDKYVWNPTRHCSSCRKLHGNRFMVGCGRCDDWFHGECVGLSLAQAQQMEVDDKEYICAKCCAEEEKMDTAETIVSGANQNIDLHQDLKTLEDDKPVMTGCPSLTPEKSKVVDDPIKHKVKISKKNSGNCRHVSESKDSENKKHASNRKNLQSATVVHRVSDEGREKSSKDSTTASSPEEKITKSGVNEKLDIKRKKPERKGSTSAVPTSSPSTPKPSVDQIRQSVRHSLKDILVKRLSESTSKIPAERATKVSVKIEKELFTFYRDTDSKYKNKYRSLMFNLRDPKNNVLYKRVLRGDITPEHLIKMTPEELASRELAAWRQRENRHTIEMIEKEQREVERRPITKITHKGEIEIESDAPMKEPEVMDTEESVVKPVEKEEELQKDTDMPVESTSDTTTQHKNHLFDLNCKICTGRMAPPTEDLSPKKVKLSMGIMRKQSDEADNTTDAPSSVALNINLLEADKPESPKETFFSAASSEPFNITDTAEDESTFLARLNYIWKGFLNMPSVAKFIIKAYPVSGTLEHLTEDLPDSIQVGGRISPQTVWDYVEKIKASGTKETCVIRFSPETEEDQISYTLLYSYFSSRKRYGVVANNMRLVKDMYLIPLGAAEKIPHFFVPFDGPGLEARRPNLLLALIIRQKVKRQHSTNPDDETLGSLLSATEKRSRIEPGDDDDEEDDENDFFNSFTAVLHKNRNRQQLSDTEEPPQVVVEPVPEAIKREPPKPLRFLPGVLVGWENPQSTLDLANRPLPDDDILQSLLGTTDNAFEHKLSSITANVEKPVKELKVQATGEPIISDKSLDDDVEMDTVPNTIKETIDIPSPLTVPIGTSSILSLKGKPPDVSTEAFLATINVCSSDEIIDNESVDVQQDTVQTANPNLSPIPVTKSDIDDNASTSVDANGSPLKSPKLMHVKRDPRQAAGRSHQTNSFDIKDFDLHKNEGNKQSPESTSRHKKDKTKKHCHEENDLTVSKSGRSKSNLPFSPSLQNETELTEASKTENAKQFPPDLLIDETDPLQQFRRALAANKSQAPEASHTENSAKIPAPAFPGNFSALRLQPPPFLPLKSNPPPFPFQHTASFPLQGNPLFPYAPHIPPLLPTPLGIGFPRPPRFHSAEANMHNPLVAWHPALQLARQPPNFFGHVTPGPLLSAEQVRYQSPQKLYHKDHRGQERRHSDPWDKQDSISDRSLSRERRSEHRQRFYSESHHSRDKRHEKESGGDKHGDRDSERSRRRDKDKERSHDRDRKSRDESHREKERSRASDKSSKEGKNGDKSKSEDRAHEKDKNRDRNRDREEDKERDRHHKDRSRDHSDKSKSKR